MCVALLDLDHFKAYNDEHGHPAGDRLLKAASAAWEGRLRKTDLLARYGGEEFAVLLPDCQLGNAMEIAERLRTAQPEGTCSIGVADWDGRQDEDELIARADRALYAAKAGGRNQCRSDAAPRPATAHASPSRRWSQRGPHPPGPVPGPPVGEANPAVEVAALGCPQPLASGLRDHRSSPRIALVGGAEVGFLLVAGVLAGVAGSVAGLASLVSYPALLAVGLPALTANVTNTVALVLYTVGAASFSRQELAGQAARLRRLSMVTVAGGATGAALLLSTPAEVFELLVPVLIGAASLVLLLQPGITRLAGGMVDERSPALLAGVFGVGVYGGYFGAAAGVVLLALLTVSVAEPLARLVAARNVALGLANLVAAAGFALFGPVRWAAAAPLAAGFLIGGGIGPGLVRRLPGNRLRVGIALLGLGLAVKLGLDTFGQAAGPG